MVVTSFSALSLSTLCLALPPLDGSDNLFLLAPAVASLFIFTTDVAGELFFEIFFFALVWILGELFESILVILSINILKKKPFV
jgi:hypothetical protein